MNHPMHDFVNGCLVVLAVAAGIFLGVFLGHYHGVKETQKNILAQCAKSQFYFFDGAGVMCPSSMNNNEEKK